ncbi:MAG: hypothetical protein KDD69_17735, partial [Bdellovibrionales bacterium]|nr:hypothetical protein [Bdellovibrionales bacterium]
MEANNLLDCLELRDEITGYWVSQAIYAAAKLGLADHFSSSARQVEELARETETKPDMLFRLLRALASHGIFAEDPPGSFRLTPKAELLKTDHPASLRYYSIFFGEYTYTAFSNLLTSIRTGESAFSISFGMNYFDFIADRPDAALIFNNAMGSVSLKQAEILLKEFEFSPFKQIIDIGGGNCVLLFTILEAYPHLEGALFELSSVISDAKENLRKYRVDSARVRFLEGSFFESVPECSGAFIL